MKSSSTRNRRSDDGPLDSANAHAPRELKLGSFLPYRLNVATALVSRGLAKIYGERFGINIPSWRVLATVAEFGSITATATGAHAHISKVKVSRAVSLLEKRELIKRIPNKKDQRESFLTLTDVGRSMFAEITPLALDYVAELTAEIADEQLALFYETIDKLLHKAMAMDRLAPDDGWDDR